MDIQVDQLSCPARPPRSLQPLPSDSYHPPPTTRTPTHSKRINTTDVRSAIFPRISICRADFRIVHLWISSLSGQPRLGQATDSPIGSRISSRATLDKIPLVISLPSGIPPRTMKAGLPLSTRLGYRSAGAWSILATGLRIIELMQDVRYSQSQGGSKRQRSCALGHLGYRSPRRVEKDVSIQTRGHKSYG